MQTRAILLAGLVFGAAATAAALESGPSPWAAAYTESMHKMHSGMMIDYTGNPDRDFVRGMIPHHEGALDMAEIELKYGTDPKIRALAEDIVKAQKKEIAFMKDWLKSHPQ